MAKFEELFAPSLGSVVDLGLKKLVENLESIYNSSTNFEETSKELDQELQNLLTLRDYYEKQVQRQRYDKDPTMIFRSWNACVVNIVAELKELRDKNNKEPLSEWNLLERSKLSKKMARKHAQVTKLIEMVNNMKILDDKAPKRVLMQFDAPKILGYPTLENALKMILRYLKNKRMKAIGVHGTKGVGKTTIMKNLNNSDEVSKLFEMVIFMTGSECQDDQQLQEAIVKRLKLNIEAISDSTNEVARRIQEELRNKKVLFILDEVKGTLNLQQLGILSNDNGSKVVMASQFHICIENNMGPLIEVKRLQTDEAWQMFQDVVGPVINRRGILPIAQHVCERCSGLPLLIHKIASSFKSKGDAPSWRAALKDLDKTLRARQNDVLKELYSFLTFCYDQLQDQHQKCFLYTSLYPADSKVYTKYLVECWAAQGFLNDLDEIRRYQDAHDNGHMIIGELVNASLLERERMICVTMNSCMRQLALHILSDRALAWMKDKWVSLIDTNLHNLPLSQDSSVLETILLQKNSELATIPTTFFEHMNNLLVLNLHGTGIRGVPSSISKLINLKALYLNACEHLNELPPEMKSLENLEILDIRGTQVGFMPSCIGSLTNLRCLRLPFRKNDNQSDHQDVISKLQKLEELIIEVISYKEWCNQVKNVMKELVLLPHLTILSCSFPSSASLTSFMAERIKQFTSFQFFIGCQNTKCPQILQYFKDEITKYLKYCNGEEDDVEMGEVLRETEVFELISHKSITDLADLGIENLNNICGFWIEDCNQVSTLVDGDKNNLSGSILPHLEQLYLRNLAGLEYVFKGLFSLETFCQLHTLELENCSNLKSIFSRETNANDSTRNTNILPNLEKLYLKNMPILECVFIGPLPPKSFSKLQILALEDCRSLGSIFSDGAIQNFSELQKLKVQHCPDIKILTMVIEDIENGRNVLPALEKLELSNLVNLKFICETHMLAWSSLEALEVHECPKLESLPFQKDKESKLKRIKGEQEWWNKLKETNKEVHQQFEDIFVATRG